MDDDVRAFLMDLVGASDYDALLRDADRSQGGPDLNEEWIANARWRAADLLRSHGLWVD